MKIEEKLTIMLKQLTSSEKVVFLSAFIGGLIAHLFVFTNIIPNFDGISRVYDEQQMTIAGRWFLHYASSLNRYTQMPMVIGVLASFFLALSALLVVRMFQIKNVLLAGVWGLVFVVFPAIADTYAYIFTASAYAIAILLAIIGVMFSRKNIWGIVAGAVCLAFSMGIYQTYAAVAIILSVLLIIKESTDNKRSAKDIIRTGVGYVMFLSAGAAIYYLLLLLFLRIKKLEMWSYLGMSDVTQGYPVEKLPEVMKQTYVQVADFFFGGANGLNGSLFLGINLLLSVCSVILVCAVIKERKLYQNILKSILFVILIALLPLAANFVQVMSPLSTPRLLMKLAFVFLYLLPIIFFEQLDGTLIKAKGKSGVKLVLSGSLLLLSLYFWEYDNVLYTMLSQTHRATLSYVTNMVSRIESCEGYRFGMQIVVIGGFPAEKYDATIEAYDDVRSESALSSSVIPLNKHIYYYMNDWLNVPAQEPEDELCLDITSTDAFQQMTLYPDDGSVQIIGDCVVVKVRDKYNPKSQYEKEYDNRR